MTTMLEKAARALAENDGHIWEDMTTAQNPVLREFQQDYINDARAVLMAVREPSDGMCDAGNDADYGTTEGIGLDRLMEGPGPEGKWDGDWREGLGNVFTAMIDHILSEGEG